MKLKTYVSYYTYKNSKFKLMELSITPPGVIKIHSDAELLKSRASQDDQKRIEIFNILSKIQLWVNDFEQEFCTKPFEEKRLNEMNINIKELMDQLSFKYDSVTYECKE